MTAAAATRAQEDGVSYQLLLGDCIETMRGLPAGSVHCCVTSPPYYGLRAYLPNGHDDKHLEIGAEETPEAYVAKLVEVFREVRRVLHPTGVIWVNLGDSYATKSTGNMGTKSKLNGAYTSETYTKTIAEQYTKTVRPAIPEGIKAKDLYGIPWMVAFALRADGWYLRSDIIWHKPNPMPESVTDRPTKAHEYIFLLSKSSSYYYDGDAVREPYNPNSLSRYESPMMGTAPGARKPGGDIERREREKGVRDPNPNGRNRRSVWTVTTESYDGAHFATYPTKLIEPCILAGTSAHGCCAACGAPWARVVERGETRGRTPNDGKGYKQRECTDQYVYGNNFVQNRITVSTTTGWQPTCTCNADVVPCTVLDPFSGSGTTGAVALKHGRKYIGCELNESYIQLSIKRIEQSQPLLFDVSTTDHREASPSRDGLLTFNSSLE